MSLATTNGEPEWSLVRGPSGNRRARRTAAQIGISGDQLGHLKLSATFRSDNVEGFVRLMASDFGMKASWRGDDQIVLTASR